MVLRTLLGEGPTQVVSQISLPLRPEQIFLVGCRDLDSEESRFIQVSGLHSIFGCAADCINHLSSTLHKHGFKRLYLHIDLDVLDPSSFPDSLMPTPSGFSIEELASMIRTLVVSFEIVGVSILEYCDRSGKGMKLLRQLIEESGLIKALYAEFKI